MSNYFAGITVGVIILQTMVFAPTIFRTLDPVSYTHLTLPTTPYV